MWLDVLHHYGSRVTASELLSEPDGPEEYLHLRSLAEQPLARFIEARLDEEAGSARRCDGDGCGEWSAHGHTVGFSQVDLAGFHPTIALHVVPYDPARVLREFRPSAAVHG